jgi:RNA polymerase sigma-70 factor (ECF subfamily)
LTAEFAFANFHYSRKAQTAETKQSEVNPSFSSIRCHSFWRNDLLDRLPKVLTETGSDQVLGLCRSAERISQYRPEDANSGVALRLPMLIRALIALWTRHPQVRPFRQLLLAKGLKPHFKASPGVILFGAMRFPSRLSFFTLFLFLLCFRHKPEFSVNKMSQEDAQECFMRLWITAQPAVAGYIRSLIHSADADDVLQETALALFRRFADYDPSRPFVPWALGVAKLQVLGHRRDAARSFVTFDNELLESFTAEWTESCASSDYRVSTLEDCLSELTDRARQILLMRYYKGFTAEEIARRSASNGTAVRMMLQRIRERLRACVKHKLFT